VNHVAFATTTAPTQYSTGTCGCLVLVPSRILQAMPNNSFKLMNHLSIFALLFMLSSLFTHEGFACSVEHIEPVSVLLKESDHIVRAKVVSWRRGKERGMVTFVVSEVLKGSEQIENLEIEGRLTEYSSALSRPVPRYQHDCGRAMGCGSCYAYDYRVGEEYLLFLRRGDPYWAPVAPVNEQISGTTDIWYVWVKEELRRLSIH
jgi:hypothetical protein